MLLLWMSAHGPAENNQTGDCVSEPWKVFLITVHLRSIRVTKTNLMTFLNKGNGRKYWGSGLDTHTSNLLTLNSLQLYTCSYSFHSSWLGELLVLSKLSESVQYNIGFIGEKKRNRKTPVLQCQELTKTYKPWGIPRTYSEAALQMHFLNKGPMFLSGKRAVLVSGIFSLSH